MKQADEDKAKANKQSKTKAAAATKAADETDEKYKKHWQNMDMEHAYGVVQAFFRFLAHGPGPQNILLLQRHSVRRWRHNTAVSRCLAMMAEHQTAATTTKTLARCLAALTSVAGATDGADTIHAVRELTSR